MGRKKQHIPPGNEGTTLYKNGRDPPHFSLDHIAGDLISYFKDFYIFKYEKEIENKYGITKENDCWPVDDIKRAWGKTQRMNETSKRRKNWSLAVMVQMMKRCLRDNKSIAQSDPHEESAVPAQRESQNERRNLPADNNTQTNTNNAETVYIRVPFSEMFGHKSSFSSITVPEGNLSYKLKDKVPSFTEIKRKTSYVMLFDNRTRNAAWVYEILNKSIVEENDQNKNIVKRSSLFKVDTSIHEFFQTPEGKKSYKMPHERGHLAPACNHKRSQRAQDDTNLLSNIFPQHKNLNRGIWRKLENRCVERAKSQDVRNVHVYSGPLYLSDKHDPQRVEYQIVGGKAVPTHFFKVIIEEMTTDVLETKCYKMPNKELEHKKEMPTNQLKAVKKAAKKKSEIKKKMPTNQLKAVKKAAKKKSEIKKEMSTFVLTHTIPRVVTSKRLKSVKKVSDDESEDDELADYECDIEDIERESGLIFRDRRCEETIDRKLTVTLKTGDANTHRNTQTHRTEITVRISNTLSDPAGI